MAGSELSKAAPARSRGRRWLFRLGALALSIALLEAFSALIWWSELPGQSLAQVAERRAGVMRFEQPSIHPTEAIHPYLGWVLNPDLHPRQAAGDRIFPVNRLGYVDDGPTVCQRSADRFLVGIIGGSVAQQLSLLSDRELRNRLEAAPGISPRKIEFVRLAFSGYKQPQQLMGLSYLLSLGGELDVLINIDGYNEAALVMTENWSSGVSLAYPRAWHHRLQDVVDPRVNTASFDLLRLRVRRRRAVELADRVPFRYSPTCNLAWLAYDRWVDQSTAALGDQLRSHRKLEGHGFAKDGPKETFESKSEAMVAACGIWERASRQMHRLCSANGIRYVHVLQPNQYLEGSKPLSDFEQEKCFSPEESFAQAVRQIYPQMQTAGEVMRREGISFHDGTQLFASVGETLYSDYFCHYNQKGNDLLAEAVAGWVIEAVDAIGPTKN
jgi:hypothetical protein